MTTTEIIKKEWYQVWRIKFPKDKYWRFMWLSLITNKGDWEYEIKLKPKTCSKARRS